MVEAVNSLVPDLFAGIKGFDLTTHITADDLQFANSFELNQEVVKADAFEWFTVLIVVFFVFAAVLSSVALWYFKKENEKR